jgi:D-glycero-beta-D-manno-heptose-7-phosphate kinase
MIESGTTQQPTSFNVLVIGDSCRDCYQIGTVDRLSPEAPVPVVKVVESFSVEGMAANVTANLKALGIDPDFITNDGEIIKTRFIDQRSGQHLLRVDSEPSVVPWSGRTTFPISDYDAIVVSDYNKGFLTYEHIELIISSATGPVFIDTKKQDLSRFSSPRAYIKINEIEYKNRYSVPLNLIVTKGREGAVYKDKLFPATEVEVVDVCGAGDTFLSALVYKYLNTNNIETAIAFANKASAITVTRSGVYAPRLEEIMRV